MPVGAFDHNAQRAWEHFQVQRGIDRYRRTLVRDKEDGTTTTRDLGEVQHGQRIASELIGPMVAAVKAKQAEYADKLEDPNTKRIADATAVFGALDAETIAACAVLTALANPVDAGWTGVRVSCAARLRHELEYQEWARAEREAEKHRKEHIRERERIHTENARNAGMRLKLWGLLQMADELADFPALWFPHYADFRGRFYPRPQDLHTQGDSLVKGLLEFSEPVAITAFTAATLTKGKTREKNITSGKSFQFPRTGTSTAEYLQRGQEMLGKRRSQSFR